MGGIETLCFSCFDDIQFQLYGQTGAYWKSQKEEAEKWITKYEELGRPVIVCQHCNRFVWYTKSEDGKWTEEAEDETPVTLNGKSDPLKVLISELAQELDVSPPYPGAKCQWCGDKGTFQFYDEDGNVGEKSCFECEKGGAADGKYSTEGRT